MLPLERPEDPLRYARRSPEGLHLSGRELLIKPGVGKMRENPLIPQIPQALDALAEVSDLIAAHSHAAQAAVHLDMDCEPAVTNRC